MEQLAMGELGLNINYYYTLTQRQFYNLVNGYRRKEDFLSRERWHIGRKIMFSYIRKYLGENAKETDVITFPWESNLIKQMTEEDLLKAQIEQQESESFWESWDNRKKGIA